MHLTVPRSHATLIALFQLPAQQRRMLPWLVALSVAMTVRLVPYPFVFAGVSDRDGILAFAPFDLTLTWGPLLWGYVVALTTAASGRQMINTLRLHLAPGALYVLYRCVCLAMPLDLRAAWYVRAHTPLVLPAMAFLSLASLGIYAVLAWKQYAAWPGRPAFDAAQRARWREWMGGAARGAAMLAGGVVALLLLVHLFVVPLIFLAELPLAVAYAVLAYMVIVTVVRLAHLASDAIAEAVATISTVSRAAAAERASRYRDQADAWRARVIAAAWHRDPQLTLESLARLLDTSPRTLSRALNVGLGTSFNTLINELRVEEAARLLADPASPSALEVAFRVGFASKASFNRAVKRHRGITPSALRAQIASQNPPNGQLAASETTD